MHRHSIQNSLQIRCQAKPETLAQQQPQDQTLMPTLPFSEPKNQRKRQRRNRRLLVRRLRQRSAMRNSQTEVDRLNTERATLSAALERSETDKTAAEGKAQAMQSVAYGAIIIALLAIVSAVIFVGRNKSTSARHRWIGPETTPLEVTGHSPVAETQPKSTGGEPQPSGVTDVRSSPSEAAQASTSNVDIVGSQSESGVSETKSKA